MLDFMKIAFFDIYDPLPVNSGGDWYRFQLLTELGNNNEVTEYFTYNISDKIGILPDVVNFKTHYLNSKVPWYKVSKILEILKLDYLFYNDISKVIKCDAIFCTIFCYHIAFRIARKSKLPLILVMHNVEWQYLKYNNSKLWLLMKYYEHFVYKRADHIITISARDHAYVKKQVPWKKIFCVPPKINNEIFNIYGSYYDYGNDKFNILFYGSLDRVQNIEALNFILNKLIPALKENQLMKDVRINIFGSGNPPESINLQNNKDINFFGAVENPGDYVRGADVVIVPLINSGGIKIRLLEALACRKFIVASPEAVEGLPKEIQEMIYIARNDNEFVGLIDNIKCKRLKNKVDYDYVQQLLLSDSILDVMNCIKMVSDIN